MNQRITLILLCIAICSFTPDKDEEIAYLLEEMFWYENMSNKDTSYTYKDILTGTDYKYINYLGQKTKEGKYYNGLKTGKWTYYDTDGDITAVRYYEEGIPSGEWQYYYKDSIVYSEQRNDTILQVLHTYQIDTIINLFTMKHGRWTMEYVSLSSMDIEYDSIYILKLNDALYTGYYIHESVPTTTWMGMAEVKNGIEHGEHIFQGGKRLFLINGFYFGAAELAQIRYSEFQETGSYYNDKKVGIWTYDSFDGNYTGLLTYQSDSVVNYKFYDSETKMLIKDNNIIDSLMNVIFPIDH